MKLNKLLAYLDLALRSRFNSGNFPFIFLPGFLVDFLVKYYKSRVRSARYVFVANTGRSGSEYIANALSANENTICLHEPRPRMNGPLLYKRLSNESSYLKPIKTLGILRNSSGKEVEYYIETSHMFLKSYIGEVAENFDDITVLLVRRKVKDLFKSFNELDYFGKNNNQTRKWMHDKGYHSSSGLKESYTTKQDKILAYIFDMHCRFEVYQREFSALNTIEILFDEIIDTSTFENKLQSNGLDLKVFEVPDTEKNKRASTKKYRIKSDINYDLRIQQFINENDLSGLYEIRSGYLHRNL